ncbi:hypothetical protein K8354_16340 [Polaribacter litorisediminis]|uniref:hypothetical protein n=1 Tax=Polaribacter litorisediminis TaxID=1908341 RepID=UPI001CC07FB1|nr:hypothetical protein [Polaribacter litorisediminis]UAM97838.1 hypothetical protein K8354_16340 [Polaribacter litorisediminis]
MRKLELLSFTFYILFISISLGQGRKMYVDNFSNILGSYTLEKELLEFVDKNDIEEIILYDLNKVHKRFPLGDASQNGLLAKFIAKAKKEHHVKSVSASGETGNFFIKAIHPYNVSRTKQEERFDVYNLEYEYWNKKQSLDGGYYCETYLKKANMSCNRESSFKYYINSLFVMKSLAEDANIDIKIEAYVGKFTRQEADQISKHVDMLLVHDYVEDPKYSYLYVKERLNHLDAIHSHIEISILFSEENNFMGKWLRNHEFEEAERIFFTELEKKQIALEEHLNFQGFTYYNYSFFKRNLKKIKSLNKY